MMTTFHYIWLHVHIIPSLYKTMLLVIHWCVFRYVFHSCLTLSLVAVFSFLMWFISVHWVCFHIIKAICCFFILMLPDSNLCSPRCPAAKANAHCIVCLLIGKWTRTEDIHPTTHYIHTVGTVLYKLLLTYVARERSKLLPMSAFSLCQCVLSETRVSSWLIYIEEEEVLTLS